MKKKITIAINKPPHIRPRGSWVLVQPEGEKKENEFGLTVPDSVEKEKKAKGVILEVGPKVTDLKKGQMVIYGQFAGEEIQLGHKEYEKDSVDIVLLLDEDILAIIE